VSCATGLTRRRPGPGAAAARHRGLLPDPDGREPVEDTEFFGTPSDAAARERMIKQSPLTHAGNVKTPTLFVHGEVDQSVPYEEGEQMYFALKRRGVPARMIQYAGQPHGIAGHWNNVHRMLNELAWWNQYLKGGSTAPRTTSSGG
jgi:dipeptidyl aminopeptidase/acylaminoacyl peptidase